MIDDAINVLTDAVANAGDDDVIHARRDSDAYSAKCALLSNLAASYATKGALDLARQSMSELVKVLPSGAPVKAETILVAVYIALREHKRLDALGLLRTRNLSLFN